jgi:hypothetical protein
MLLFYCFACLAQFGSIFFILCSVYLDIKCFSSENIFNEIIFQKKNNFAENIFHHLAHIKKLLTAKNHC